MGTELQKSTTVVAMRAAHPGAARGLTLSRFSYERSAELPARSTSFTRPPSGA
jgi:hypothetical protein